MGIKAGKHAIDCTAHQIFIANIFNIFGADPFEHVHEPVELTIGTGINSSEGRREGGDKGQCAQGTNCADDWFWHGFHSLKRSAHNNTIALIPGLGQSWLLPG